MPTSNPRVTFTMSDDMHAAIDEYRFDHRFKSQTLAIVSLIQMGLSSLGENSTTPQPLLESEAEMLSLFCSLNPSGQKLVFDYLNMLVSKTEYRKEESNKSAI